MNPARRLLSSALAATVLAVPCAAAAELPAKCYLFSYFIGNGEDGLHLAWSPDGLKWTALKGGKSFLTPEVGGKLMRDPCVTAGPDGTFHMVWTDSWHGTTIGYASSADLITWTPQRSLAVMKDEPAAKNCWAPELVYDAPERRFMIFWASTVPGRFPATEFGGKNDNNHRIYATTTRDFTEFDATRLFFDPGFNCIDATILPVAGKAVMVFKDETKHPRPMKNLRLATAAKPAGPYQVEAAPINPPDSWVEGPSLLQVGDTVFLYFDAYTKHRYAALKSRDWRHWEDATPDLVMPPGIRHGTAFGVSGAVVTALLAQ